MIVILAGLLLPALSSGRERARAAACINNTRQLTFGWLMYADDHSDVLPYNIGSSAGNGVAALQTNMNWVNGVMTWGLESDNTNTDKITGASLGSYVSRVANSYRCPSDRAVSSIQRQDGWTARARSYSMNAMVGNAGPASANGYNINNPYYQQIFKLQDILIPASIFVFLDEHPDSIDDGYFVNRAYNLEWIDLPASYHNGAAAISFADGHCEMHRWQVPSTCPPPQPDAGNLPISLQGANLTDFNWVIHHMSQKQ